MQMKNRNFIVLFKPNEMFPDWSKFLNMKLYYYYYYNE